MKTLKRIKDLAPVLMVALLYGCPAQEVELPGDISGSVKDAESEESLQDAEVELFLANDLIGTYTTGMDGTFLFTNLEPEDYSLEVVKDLYERPTENISVFPATTSELEIRIRGVPKPAVSTSLLHYGMEATQLSFTISNVGVGILKYEMIPSHDWITVSQDQGEITHEPDLIEVTIQREELQEVSHLAWIAIRSDILGDIQIDSLGVYVNYVMDRDSLLYRTVKIGSQVWMAENLNTGIRVEAPGSIPTTDNGIVEKLCYDNNPLNCDIYGGLYMWREMMDYAPPDTAGIRSTQGICPDGWHVPTHHEWIILRDYLGGEDQAGGMLKDTSLLWEYPNRGATNETGFSALPAGLYRSWLGEERFENVGAIAHFWTTYLFWTANQHSGSYWKAAQLYWLDASLMIYDIDYQVEYPTAMSVRCVKDP